MKKVILVIGLATFVSFANADENQWTAKRRGSIDGMFEDETSLLRTKVGVSLNKGDFTLDNRAQWGQIKTGGDEPRRDIIAGAGVNAQYIVTEQSDIWTDASVIRNDQIGLLQEEKLLFGYGHYLFGDREKKSPWLKPSAGIGGKRTHLNGEDAITKAIYSIWLRGGSEATEYSVKHEAALEDSEDYRTEAGAALTLLKGKDWGIKAAVNWNQTGKVAEGEERTHRSGSFGWDFAF